MVFHHKEVNFTLVTAQKETKSWLNLFFLARRIFKGKTCAIYAVSDSKWPVLKNMAKMCPTCLMHLVSTLRIPWELSSNISMLSPT
jgi:hypothetical protein